MKLAQIIIPKFDNAHTPLALEHADVRAEIIKRWSGFTQTEGEGVWCDEDGKIITDLVRIYYIAMERGDVIQFREWAKDVAKLTRQQCVMIATPCGDVEFVKPSA